jgi:TolA-binding protein
MVRGWFHLGMVVGMLLTVAQSPAAETEEDRMFTAARMAFQDEIWRRAAREFEQFTIRHPLSPKVPEAVLLQARALLNLSDPTSAIKLLTEQLPRAGALADEYLFWTAEAHFQRKDYPQAAQTYARLLAEHAGSPRALEAQIGEAASMGRLKRWDQVVRLIRRADAPLAQSLAAGTAKELVARGQLLLAEALLAGGDPAGAEAVATVPQLNQLDPVLEWQRVELLTRAWMVAGRLQDALVASTNLLTLADKANRPVLRYEGVLLQGRLFEQHGEAEAAAVAYRSNLATNVPPAAQRQALLRLSDLLIARGQLGEARSLVEQFIALEPHPPGLELAQMTLGELKLRQHLDQQARALTQPDTAPNQPTNLLELAAADFAKVIQTSKDPLVLTRAYINQGWVQWLAEDFKASASSFEKAATMAQDPSEEAVARFKWADSLYRLGDFPAARTNYLTVSVLARVAGGAVAEIEEPALYQAMRSALAENQAGLANQTLQTLLNRFPDGFHASSSVLLTGQGLEGQGQPEAARRVFEEFLAAEPETPLAAEIRLAIARTYETEQQWSKANEAYQAAAASTEDDALKARAEYFRAQTTALSGNEAEALNLFTNFLARFPNQPLSPRAQWWIADHYWRQGDFEKAELNYQLLFGNWPNSPLAYEARMMAGRAAMARVSFADAIDYFTNLTSDLSCPPAIKEKALFAYGDALMRAKPPDTNSPFANYELALEVFRDVERLYPSNDLAARAAGLVGNCHLILAAADPGRYLSASNAYYRALQSPAASVAARSEAEFGLATVLEKLAAGKTDESRTNLLQAALDRHLNILYGTLLREGESADPFWTRKAGIEAGRIAELLQQWSEARNIYETLLDLLPPLRPLLENKILKANEQALRAKT